MGYHLAANKFVKIRKLDNDLAVLARMWGNKNPHVLLMWL